MKRICVIGMGYVGLTLAVTLADVGFKVNGVEINEKTARRLQAGKPHFHEPELEFLLNQHLGGNLSVTQAVEKDGETDTYIIAVATPVDKEKKPVMDYVRRATEDVAGRLKAGDLVILRSTVPVGTTNGIVRQIILEKTGLVAGKDVHLVFAPERTIEGKALEELRYLPQIIGGTGEEAVGLAANIFNRVTNTIVRVSSIEAAEIVKQLDNIYRDVNIALGNEIGLACEKLGLNAHEIIRAANMNYKRNNLMVPGAGVGGACLTKDPYIFLSQLPHAHPNSIILNSRKINESMPLHVLSLAKEALSANGVDIKGARVAVLGIAFKGRPETSDVRFSPTEDLVMQLKGLGADVVGMDHVAKPEEFAGIARPVGTYNEAFDGADCIIIMNNHPRWKEIDLRKYAGAMKKKVAVVDGWNMLNPAAVKSLGFVYRGVGVE